MIHLAPPTSGHEEVAKVLVEAGARWTILTKRLQSPYDLAASRGHQIEALRIQEVKFPIKILKKCTLLGYVTNLSGFINFLRRLREINVTPTSIMYGLHHI